MPRINMFVSTSLYIYAGRLYLPYNASYYGVEKSAHNYLRVFTTELRSDGKTAAGEDVATAWAC
jgi:hypothetical protein